MKLSMALELYERHMPFFTGQITGPEGVELDILEVGETLERRHGLDRHHRMLKDLEFDICEMSLGSYILGLSRDPSFPMVGIPVFPRRYFSMSQIYINANTGINTPRDLIGKNVGITAFQVTLSVLAKGDLKRDYDVDWRDINWRCMRPEQLPVEFPPGVSVQQISADADIGEMLAAGEIDALICPQPPAKSLKSLAAAGDKVRRLFLDPETEDEGYFKKYGYFPIMHLLVMRRDVITKVPELPNDLIHLWDQAKNIAYKYYDDPAYALLAWTSNIYKAQSQRMAPDLWPSGISANRNNLEAFLGYCDDQGLLDRQLSVEDLFIESVHNS